MLEAEILAELRLIRGLVERIAYGRIIPGQPDTPTPEPEPTPIPVPISDNQIEAARQALIDHFELARGSGDIQSSMLFLTRATEFVVMARALGLLDE